MKISKELIHDKMMVVAITTLLVWLYAGVPAAAQKGDNAVWSTSTMVAPSSAFIDASVYCTGTGGSCSSNDFCNVVNQALFTLPAAGGVVDARGINTGGSNSCAQSPYVSPNTIKVPSTLLLPSGTITISKGWILPNGTKVIGQAAGYPGYAVTVLKASTSFPASGTMIQMGPNSSDSPLVACPAVASGGCTEVSVEDLELEGGTNGSTISGIVNGQSQDLSYVRRVSMYQLGGIGLKVWSPSAGSGQNSGPYSDITFDDAGVGSSTEECVELDVTTRGVHGLSCKSSTDVAARGVFVNSSNNSITDVHVQGAGTAGFTDGIQVSSIASSDVLFNIAGGTGITNLVHLESSSENISVMGAGNGGNSSTNTIDDSATSAVLNDPYVAMYVLGVAPTAGFGYSRFTTSSNANVGANSVTWGVGGTLPSSCPTKGSLFSLTSSTGNLFVCTSNGGTWTPLT